MKKRDKYLNLKNLSPEANAILHEMAEIFGSQKSAAEFALETAHQSSAWMELAEAYALAKGRKAGSRKAGK